jgi:DNA repair exonuclease SbcCD ATPase subunit
MLVYKSLELQNILYFKKVKFLFKNGITVVRGLNKNNTSLPTNTNGVGKSLLFSCIPNVLYFTTPLAKKNDKKSIFNTNTSTIRFTFKKGSVLWTIEQKSKGKSIVYDILKDGDSIKPRTPSIAEDKISELLDISEDLFYTKDYVSIQRPHLFLRGTNIQRQDFFSEVFNLNHYDNVKTLLQAQVRELKHKKSKLEALEEHHAELVEKLKSLNWTSEKENELSSLEEELKDLNTKYTAQATTLTHKQAHLTLVKRINSLLNKLDGEQDYKKVKVKKLEYKKQLSCLQEYSEYSRAIDRYIKDTEELSKQLKQTKKKLQHLNKPKTSLEQLEEKIEKLKTKKVKLKLDKIELEKLRRSYEELDSSLSGNKPKHTEDELVVRINELNQIISLYNSLSNELVTNKCPLCQSKVNIKDLGKIYEEANSELPKRKKELKIVKILSELKQLKLKAKKYKGCEEELESVVLNLNKLEKEHDELVEYQELENSVLKLERLLQKVHQPKLVDKPESNFTEKELEKRISDCDKFLALLEELDELKKEELKIYKITSKEKILNKECNELEKSQNTLSKKINRLNETLPLLLSDQKQVSDVHESLDAITLKLDKMRSELKDLPILEALIKAYSSKGLKVEVMKRIASLVEANLNLYSQLIFAENFKFSIQIEENSFAVNVNRKGIISDISKLSGAESSCFILLLLLSILPLIPRRKRTDTIVLDEVDAFMGPPLKKLYFTKFLPMLQTVVPKICVITTAKNVDIEGARYITVVKDGEESKLEESLNSIL